MSRPTPHMTPEEAMARARLARLERQEEDRRRRQEARQASAERRREREEAMIRAEAETMLKAATPDVDRRIVGACIYCGTRGNYVEAVRSQPLGVSGPMCQPCRNTDGDLPAMVTRRLRRERPDLLEGFKPEPDMYEWHRPGRALQSLGWPTPPPDVDDWDVVTEPVLFTWAHRVLEARRQGKPDPKPPRQPFGWLP